MVRPAGDAQPAAVDGVDLSGTLRDATSQPRQEIYFHYPHYYHAPATTPCGAVRSGDFKLIEWFEDNRVELYDLAKDEREQNDLSAQQQEQVAQLRSKLSAWRTSVKAAMPTRR